MFAFKIFSLYIYPIITFEIAPKLNATTLSEIIPAKLYIAELSAALSCITEPIDISATVISIGKSAIKAFGRPFS